jgi:hypothetical protein
MRKVILFAAIALVALVAYVSADEELSSVANQYLETTANAGLGPSRAYRVALGMHADFDEDPYEVGSTAISDYLDASKNLSIYDDVSYPEYPEEKKVFVPSSGDGELYCLFAESDCLSQLLLDGRAREEERHRLAQMVERYDDYLTTEDYRTEIPAGYSEPIPNFRYMFAAQRMKVFAAMSIAEQGDAESAVKALLEDLKLLRGKLKNSDHMIHKMITVAQVRDQLEAIAFIHSVFDAPDIGPISRLTEQELDFGMPLRTEFGLVHQIAEYMDGNPGIVSDEVGLPVWMSRFVFPANKITNSAAEQVHWQTKLTQLSPEEFAEQVDQESSGSRRLFSIIPSVNNALTEISSVDYIEYIARTYDLNTKIELVNAQLTGEPNAIVNPYYPSSEVVLSDGDFDESDIRVCMDGPLPDEKGTRCLTILGVHEGLISLLAE